MSLDPVGDKDIGIALFRGIAIGAEDELFAIRRKHREAIEAFVEGDLLLASAVNIDGVNIEVSSTRIAEV